jgi:hypothetical protein
MWISSSVINCIQFVAVCSQKVILNTFVLYNSKFM